MKNVTWAWAHGHNAVLFVQASIQFLKPKDSKICAINMAFARILEKNQNQIKILLTFFIFIDQISHECYLLLFCIGN